MKLGAEKMRETRKILLSIGISTWEFDFDLTMRKRSAAFMVA